MANYWKFLKYLFIPGIIFLVAGLIAQYVTGISLPLYLDLTTAGAVILVIWLLLFLWLNRSFWQKRSTQVGTNILISTLAFITILVLVNFLAFSYAIHVDFTENQLYTLAPQSQQLLKNLSLPVKVFVFLKEADPVDKELLNTYRQSNSNFQFEFINPETKPGIARQFSPNPLGSIYLEYANKKQLVQYLQLDPRTGNPTENISEIKLTSALERIQKKTLETIYILQGHEEPNLEAGKDSISEAINALKDKGYQIKPLNLAQETAFPKEIASLLIIGSRKKFLESEIKLIKEYVDQGGNLLLLVDPQTDLGLDTFLQEWGVKLDPRLVIDASGRGSLIGVGPESPIITKYGNHPITKEFKNGISVYPLTRPIGTVKIKGVEANGILTTDDKMWATSKIDSEQVSFNPLTDLTGPFDIGVALTRPSDKQEAKMVVIGNSTFMTNGWFPKLLNGDVFVNSVQWLSRGEEQPLSIRPKEAKNRRIILTPLQSNLLGWSSLVIVPLLGFILAILFWWRRR